MAGLSGCSVCCLKCIYKKFIGLQFNEVYLSEYATVLLIVFAITNICVFFVLHVFEKGSKVKWVYHVAWVMFTQPHTPLPVDQALKDRLENDKPQSYPSVYYNPPPHTPQYIEC